MEITYYFNQATQALDLSFENEGSRGSEWQEITAETHAKYLEAKNNGRMILGEYKFSEPQPSGYHVWSAEGKWIDPRTPEQIKELEIKMLTPLTRRQFRRVMVLNNFDLDEIRAKIQEIEDPKLRQLTLIDWDDSDTFERLNESLVLMAEMLGMSEQQVNTMWKQALTL